MKKEESIVPFDQNFKDKQFKKFTDGMGELGDYAKEMKKTQKLSNKLNIIYTILFLFLIVGIIGYSVYNGGGVSGFLDSQTSKRYFNCTANNPYALIPYNQIKDTVRTYEDAIHFEELYSEYHGECTLWIK